MRIIEITHQHRRDFVADFQCEHCGRVVRNMQGYDDDHFHRNVIPTIPCPDCRKTSPESYRPLTTKYPEGFQI